MDETLNKNIDSYRFRVDLKKAKKLKTAKLRAEAKRNLAKAYHCSYQTICREWDKKQPGIRATRSDEGKEKNKVTSKEKKIAAEVIETGRKMQDVKKVLEQETGKPVSTRKLNKISKAVAEQKEPEEQQETSFKDPTKDFLEKHFKLDLIAPDRGINCNISGRKARVMKQDVEDIIMVLANALNRDADDKDKIQLDRMQYMKMKIIHLLDEQVRIAQSMNDVKRLNAITLMYQRLETDYGELSPDLNIVIKCFRALKPDITTEQCFGLIEKYSK